MKLKHTLALAAFVAGSLFVGNVTLQAQDSTNTPPARSMRARPSFDTITKQLELTDAQKPKVKVIIDEMQQKQRELRQDSSVPQAERRGKFKEIRDAATVKMKEILTAEQLAKWEKMGQGGPRQRPGGNATAQPKAPKE